MKTARIFRMIFSIIAVCSITMCDYDVRTNPNDPKSDDYVEPIEGTFVIGNGIATNQTSVTLTMNIPGASEMRFGNSVNERNSADWEEYAATKSWEIAGAADGERTVYGEFRNYLGDVLQPSATIFYDTAAPTGCSVVINNGDATTDSLTAVLTLSATDDITMGYMRFSNDNAVWSEWENYSVTKTWELNSGEGTKTVYAEYRDVAGNIAGAADTIIYDDTLEPDIAVTQAGSNITAGSGTFDYGTTAVDYPVEYEFTVSNNGTADLVISSIEKGVDTEFNLSDLPAIPATVPIGSSVTFKAQYNPSAAGDHLTSISISSNDPDEDPFTFSLTGKCGIGVGAYDRTRTISCSVQNAVAVTTDGSGNVFMTGSFMNTVNFGASFGASDSKSAIGNDDVFVTRINADGTYGWTRRIGGDDGQVLSKSITTDSSGNIYITGEFSNGEVVFDTDFGTTNSSKTPASSDCFVTKINSNGTYGWTRQIGGTGNESGYGITSDGTDIYVTGSFQTTVVFDTDFGTTSESRTSAGSSDIFVTKITAAGEYGWTRTFGGTGDDYGFSIAVNGTNIFITGKFESEVIFGNDTGFVGATTNTKTSAGSADIFVTKIGTGGTTYGWTHRIGGTNLSTGDYGVSITTDSSGNIYVAGYVTGAVTFDTDFGTTADAPSAAGGMDIFVTKIAAAGTYGWTRRMGGGGDDYGCSVDTDSADNVYLTGHFYGTAYFGTTQKITTGGVNMDYDAFVTKLSSGGVYDWTYKIGGGNTDYGRAISVDNNDYIYIMGFSRDSINYAADFGETDGMSGEYIFLTKIY